uniref:hypothetical protein n=1 Tax=Agathobacter sp. TaxID=2021311 RepID=UPI004056C981
MGDNLLKVLFTSIKAKVTPLVTKIKLWTSWNFIRTKLISSIRDFFFSLLDIKPRHKNDYYEVFGWLISRRLAVAAVVVVGVCSLYYLFCANSIMGSSETGGVKTYPYDSVLLRFAEGNVRILGEDGYLAYEGEVADGAVNGYGTLHNRDGVVVYQGDFENNLYHGNGIQYYDDGTMQYIGSFEQNKFAGTGKLYRRNGSLAYEGEFALGLENGEGKLYDNSSNLVYTGKFHQGEIQYGELLGKKVSEVAEIYTGKRVLYEDESDFAVILKDIDAMYLGEENEDSLEDEMTVEKVLVLKEYFQAGKTACTTIQKLRNVFGEEIYQGNSDIMMAEAVAVNWLAEQGNGSGPRVDVDITAVYEDYMTVDDFDSDYTVYLYSFRMDGLVYTFVCEDKESTFSFYFIEKE